MTTPDPADRRLHDLIAAVEVANDTPLERVAGAVRDAERLEQLADALIGHFVDRARGAGASWSDIGRSLGVSKQAAQQKFVGRGRADTEPELVDPRYQLSAYPGEARAVVQAAGESAIRAHHDVVGLAHLVLGLVADPHSQAARAVAAQGVDLADVRRAAAAALPARRRRGPRSAPFDAAARAALEGVAAQARRHRADSISSGHILLAVLAAEDGSGTLSGLGVKAGEVDDFLAHDDAHDDARDSGG